MNSYHLKIIISLLTVFLFAASSCDSCKKSDEPEVTISSSEVILYTRDWEEKSVKREKGKPRIRRIEIGPSERVVEEDIKTSKAAPVQDVKSIIDSDLPPKTTLENDMTERLRDKMLDAYEGREDEIPDVQIYLSEMKYDEFVKYYEKLGYKVQTVEVPAIQVIEPVLESRPELASKLDMAKYEDTVIHQVMVDGAGISAADKYIDPDTFEVIDKTFVTKMSRE